MPPSEPETAAHDATAGPSPLDEQLDRDLFKHLTSAYLLYRVIFDGDRPVDFVFEEANPAFEAQTGQPRATVLGRRLTEVFPAIAQDPASWIELLGQVSLTGEPIRVERFDELLQRWYDVSAYRPRQGYLATIFDDITARKRSEAALQLHATALANISDAVVALDQEQRITYWGAGAERLYGLSAEEALGQPLQECYEFRFLSPEDEQAAYASLDQQGYWQGENLHLLRNGKLRMVESTVSVQRDSAGQRVGLLAVVRDITERKAAESQRESYLAQIQEANEAKDLFFNSLSHELRTPLAAMTNAVALLKKLELSKSHRSRALNILERNLQHQAHLIEDLLDMSRIMRGKIELEREWLDLREVVRAQVESIDSQARKARRRLELAAPSEPVPVLGDAVRLGQVIANLLTNAIKFTEPGGSIAVKIAAAADTAAVSVQDNGIGIPAELLPRISQPFQQGDASLARDRGGLGIGLAVSRSLTELHGGTLLVASDGPGQGSTFTVQLPLATSAPLSLEPSPASPRRGAGKRVLLIEDNDDLRESLVLLLGTMGHRAIAAANATSGLQLARRERPDVLLVDIGLPDLDGYQLARQLRADPATSDLWLIALTGYATPEHRQRALLAGFDYHLAKPITPQELAQVIGRLRQRI